MLLILLVTSQGWRVNAQATSDTDRLKTLVTLWIAQRKEIVSAHINAKVYRYAARAGAPTGFSPEIVEQVAAELAGGTVESRIKRIHELMPDPGTAGTPSWGFELEVVADATRVRNVKKSKLEPFGTVVEDWIFDGVETLAFNSANKYVEIRKGLSVPETFRIDSFRYIPNVDQHTRVERFSLVSRVEDVLRIERVDQYFTVESKTGFVRHFRDLARGKIAQDVYQFAPATRRGGIVVPTVYLRVIYNKSTGTVSVLDIVDINRFDCNIPLDASEFQLAVPENTRIRDFREDSNKGMEYITRDFVDDVLTHIVKNPPEPR